MNKDQMIAYTILTAPVITYDRSQPRVPVGGLSLLCFEANSKEPQMIKYFGKSLTIPAEVIAE